MKESLRYLNNAKEILSKTGIENNRNSYANLEKTVEELRLHAEIISHMEEGVYLIRTSDGVIVYANPKI